MAVEADRDEPRNLRPALGAAIRNAFAGYLEWIGPLLGANAIWVLIVAGFTVLWAAVPPAILLLPLLALPTAALARLAVVTVRSGVPTLPMAQAELGRYALRKLGIALVQVVLIGAGVTNLGIAPQIGGFGAVLSALVAGYAVIGTLVYVTALWPIVCDPAREGPIREQLKLALAVTLRRPLPMLVLTVIGVLAFGVCLELVVPALFLPSLVLLAMAGYVVRAADELRPIDDAEA